MKSLIIFSGEKKGAYTALKKAVSFSDKFSSKKVYFLKKVIIYI